MASHGTIWAQFNLKSRFIAVQFCCDYLLKSVPPVCQEHLRGVYKICNPLILLAGAVGIEPTAFGFGALFKQITTKNYNQI